MSTNEELLQRIERLEKANEELLIALKNALGYGIDLTDVEDATDPQIDVQSFLEAIETDPEEEARQEEEFAQWEYEHNLQMYMRLGHSEDEARALMKPEDKN